MNLIVPKVRRAAILQEECVNQQGELAGSVRNVLRLDPGAV